MANRIITINRMYGSNGRLIGKALAERLDIPFYDKELITLASQENDIPLEELRKVDEKRANQWHLPIKDAMQMEPQYHFQPMNDVLYESQSKIIHDLSEKGDCIIAGRCADQILEGKCKSIFIFAPFEYRVKNIMERIGREERSARSLVKKMDKRRRSYYEYFTDAKWLDMTHYDLCIDSSKFSQKHILDMLEAVYRGM